LPLELKYLPVIESALNPRAVSRVGATGLWQFMLATGKHYGLTVNSLIDERSDIAKSSYAAAHYLSDLYRIFGDWNLVIAAYNAGPDNINKAIHRAKGEKDYWKIYPYLPQETRGYVPAFIAANYIMNYYCEHNICPMTATLAIKTDTVVVNHDIHFNQVAGVLGIDVAEIKALNPQYRKDIVCGASAPASLRLPASMVNKFIDKQEEGWSITVNGKKRYPETWDKGYFRVINVCKGDVITLQLDMKPRMVMADNKVKDDSGCIAVTLAADLRNSAVTAWDISGDALLIARENVHQWQVRVELKMEDALHPSAAAMQQQFDIIVSNPPYICDKERTGMAKNVLAYEPETALFVPDDDPLRFYRAIAEYGVQALSADGVLYFETNPLYIDNVKQMLSELGYKQIELRKDQFGKLRFTKAIRP